MKMVGSCRARSRSDPRRGSSPYPWNARHSTYEFSKTRIAYRWHPLCGKRVLILRRVQVDGREYAHLDRRDKFSREVPAWMLDGKVCARMDLGSPQVSIAGLLELSEILRTDLVAVDGPTGARSADEELHQSAGKSRAAKSVRGDASAARNSSGHARRDTRCAGRAVARRDPGGRKGAGR